MGSIGTLLYGKTLAAACKKEVVSLNYCSPPFLMGERIYRCSQAFSFWRGEVQFKTSSGRIIRDPLDAQLLEIYHAPRDIQLEGVTYSHIMPRTFTPTYDKIIWLPRPVKYGWLLPEERGEAAFVRMILPHEILDGPFPRVSIDLIHFESRRGPSTMINTVFIFPNLPDFSDPYGVVHIRKGSDGAYELSAIYTKAAAFYGFGPLVTPTVTPADIEEIGYTTIRDILVGNPPLSEREWERRYTNVNTNYDPITITRLRFKPLEEIVTIDASQGNSENDLTWRVNLNRIPPEGQYLPVVGNKPQKGHFVKNADISSPPYFLSMMGRTIETYMRTPGCPRAVIRLEPSFTAQKGIDLI